MKLMSNINTHGVHDVKIRHESGDAWIDVIAKGEEGGEFEFTLFVDRCERRERCIAILESMKAQITNILQELDNED